MKKIVLLPSTDTVTLCLPEHWVGIPIICQLTPMSEQIMTKDELANEIERRMTYRNAKRRKKRSRDFLEEIQLS